MQAKKGVRGQGLAMRAASLAAAALTTCAAPVQEQDALKAAETFLVRAYPAADLKAAKTVTPWGASRLAVQKLQALSEEQAVIGYLARLAPSGYVLLSADDECPPVKLHSDAGSFENVPPGLLAVVKRELSEDLSVLAEARRLKRAVGPKNKGLWLALTEPGKAEVPIAASGEWLLKTAWNQNAPYNLFCPDATNGPGRRAWAGCNACALSQVLRYYKLPSAVAQDHTYSDSSGECRGTHAISDAGLGAYDWDNMPESVTTASPETQQRAVAQLVYHAAVALESQFEGDGTSAMPSSVPSVLSTYFAYTSGSAVYKHDYSTAQWYNKIAADIDAAKPVFYAMWETNAVGGLTNGHSVMCDGYQNGSEIHINLGWGPYGGNAWYNVDSVNTGGYTWTEHLAVFGITPPEYVTVAFDPAGGTACASRPFATGKSYGVLPETTREGYTFDGWWTAAGGSGAQVSEATVVAAHADYTLYAKWVARTYVVSFDAQGGSVSPENASVTFGTAYGLLPVPARPGYDFFGWMTASDGTGVQVTPDTAVAIAGDHTLYAVWDVAPFGDRTEWVAVAFDFQLPEPYAAAASVTVTGLPKGLTFNAVTRRITGVPTQSGTYTVTVAATGLVTQTMVITVQTLPAWAVGTFNGYVGGGGTVALSVTAAGKMSGKVVRSGTNYSFSASSFAGGDAVNGFSVSTAAKAGKALLPLVMTVTAQTNGAASALGAVSGVFGEEAPVTLFRNVWKDAGMADWATGYAGYYTATLPGNAEYGSGYLAFTLDKAGKVKAAGKLADGTAVSLSGTLLLDAADRLMAVVYSSPKTYQGGCFFGLAEFARPGGEGAVLVRLLDGEPCVWESRSAQATAAYGAGFAREPGLTGGWYSKTENLHAYYEGLTLTAVSDREAAAPELAVGGSRYAAVWWRPDGVRLTPTLKSGVMTGLSAQAAGKPTDADGDGIWNYEDGANTVGLKVSLARPTGIFKGSFLAWFDYPEKKHVSKSLAFEGALTPEREDRDDGVEGRGFFLWADQAVVPATGKAYAFKWSYDFLISTQWPVVEAPLEVTASQGLYADRVEVAWTPVENATHYRVYWASTATGTKTPVGGWTAETAATHMTDRPGVIYYFVRASLDEDGSYPSAYGGPGTGWLEVTDDLLVTDVTLDPASPQPGASFSASVTVKNASARALAAGDLDVWVNQPSPVAAGTRGTKYQSVGQLQSQESKTLTFTGLKAPSAAGDYVFRAFLDSRGVVAERDETNNQFTVAYQAGAASGVDLTGIWDIVDSDGQSFPVYLWQEGNDIWVNIRKGTVSGQSFSVDVPYQEPEDEEEEWVLVHAEGKLVGGTITGSYRQKSAFTGSLRTRSYTATRFGTGTISLTGNFNSASEYYNYSGQGCAYEDTFDTGELKIGMQGGPDFVAEFHVMWPALSELSPGRFYASESEIELTCYTSDYPGDGGEVATGGWIQLTRIDSRVVGTYDLYYRGGAWHVTGSFDVPFYDLTD